MFDVLRPMVDVHDRCISVSLMKNDTLQKKEVSKNENVFLEEQFMHKLLL